ncbi:MAG: dipeptidase [Lachnospiraceae bacterium]|nr:dipeptidase [Lachnospiraceae bacterium]
MLVDMHCDTIWLLRHLKEKGKAASLYQSPGHLDLQKMQKSGYLLQNFALFVEMSQCQDPWEEVQQLYGVYEEGLKANSQLLGKVLCYEDIDRWQKEGKMCSLLTVEEGGVCKGELSKLEKLYEQGVRMMTLTWNFENEIGYPNHGVQNLPEEKMGLKEKGIEFVQRMEKLGMIVDVSHLSDAGFWDVCKYSTKPFVASHSNAREVCRSMRNLTDEMIRALAEKGGVTGLNFCKAFTMEHLWRGREWLDSVGAKEPRGNQDYLQMLTQHAKHIVNVGGIECLGLGSDFDGIGTHQDLPHAGEMERLYGALKRAGFTESQLDKIWYKNVLRVYRELL